MRLERKHQLVALAIAIGVLPMGLSTPALAHETASFVPHAAPASANGVNSEEWAFLPLINDFRARNGLAPLQMSATLATASEWMSNDMAEKNYFSHTDSQGRGLKARLNSFGYDGAMGENIAAGQTSAQEAFKAWENSPGHRANMLNPNYKAIGVGRVTDASSQYKTYWTTDFGDTVDRVVTPDSAATPAPQPTQRPETKDRDQRREERRAKRLEFRLKLREWIRSLHS